MNWKSTSGATLRLAGPIIMGELVQMALHIIDAAMVGAVSYRHLAASSLAFGIITMPFVFGIGITIAIAQMSSLFKGLNDAQKVSHYFFNGMFISICTAIGISLCIYFGSDIVFHLGQDHDVAVLAQPFLELLAISLIPMICFIACKQFADGLEYTKVAMTISIIGIPINAALNWLLIFGNWGLPRLELNGAGWGTLITRTMMLAAMVLYLFRSPLFRKYWKVIRREWFLSWKTCKKLLHIGIPTAFQIVLEAGAFAISGILVGLISAEAQAAHQIAISIASFTFMVSMGLSQACSIRISNAFGRRDGNAISMIGKSTMALAIGYGLFCAIFLSAFRHHLPMLFNDDPEVLYIASTLIIWAAVFQIPDATQAIAAGALRGIRDVKIPTIYIALGYWVFGVPLGYCLAFYLGWGASGIWIGFIISLSFVGVMLASRFIRSKVITKLSQARNGSS